MPLEVRVEGLGELIRTMNQVARIVAPERTKQIYIEAGRIVYDAARRRAPYDPKRKRGTHLRDALFLGPGPKTKPDVLVGVNMGRAPHAWIVEHGRVGWPGKPYWRPALAETRHTVLAIIEQRLGDLIQKTYGGQNG